MSWNPLRFIYEYEPGKHTDVCTFNISNVANTDVLDVNFHNYHGGITCKVDDGKDITLDAGHYIDLDALLVTLKEGTSFRIDPSSSSADSTALFKVSAESFIDGDDHGEKVLTGAVLSNNLFYRIDMAKSYVGALMYIGPYIQINKDSICNKYFKKSFISGFDVISLGEADTRKEAKSQPSLQLESGAVKLKYNSDNLVLIYNDLIKLISSDFQLLQHTDDGDKTYNLCDVCRKTEQLSSLSNYEYDESTSTLIIKTV